MSIEQTVYDVAGEVQGAGFLLWQVTMAWQRHITHSLKVLGITHTQYIVMSALATLLAMRREDTLVMQSDIAATANIDVMSVSNVVRTLEKRGIVARTGHPEDSRAMAIWLTRTGEELLSEAKTIVLSSERTFFDKAGINVGDLTCVLRQMFAAAAVRSAD
jgi:DNA-binding MarR family transcriptional regulator